MCSDRDSVVSQPMTDCTTPYCPLCILHPLIHRDLCVENLIYLSHVIQFKTMYQFLVTKELEDRKSRACIVEEAEDSDHEHSHDDLLGFESALNAPENINVITEEHKSAIMATSNVLPAGGTKLNSNASASLSAVSHTADDPHVHDAVHPPDHHDQEALVHDGEEYQEIYGWNMALPQWFGTENSSNLTKCQMNQKLYDDANDEELILKMYAESLSIYERFIRVASKDEINISGKMRKSLKKYFEIEEVVRASNASSIKSTLSKATLSIPRGPRGSLFPSSAGDSEGHHQSKTDSMNFPNLSHTTLSTKPSNENMNVRLTAGDTELTEMDENDSPCTRSTPQLGDLPPFQYNDDEHEMELEDIDDGVHHNDIRRDPHGQIVYDPESPRSHVVSPQIGLTPVHQHQHEHQHHGDPNHIQIVIEQHIGDRERTLTVENTVNNRMSSKTSGINRLSERLNPRKVKREKTRSFVAVEPTDNYLALSWIQRFRIFDKSCDSIEKLLRIDSYGKFRESDDYWLFCDKMRKQNISLVASLSLNKTKVGTMLREVRRKHSAGFSEEQHHHHHHANDSRNFSSSQGATGQAR